MSSELQESRGAQEEKGACWKEASESVSQGPSLFSVTIAKRNLERKRFSSSYTSTSQPIRTGT